MKKIIRNSPAGIYSVIKLPNKKNYGLYYQGSEKSAEIFIQTVKSITEAKGVIKSMLKL